MVMILVLLSYALLQSIGVGGSGVVLTGHGMDSTAIATVTIPVIALTQIAKWTGLPDKYGPVAVLVLAVLGVAFWGWSTFDFNRATAFSYFAAWTVVATSAAGVFGFTRAAAGAVTSAQSPPAGGAGSNTTVKQ